MGEGLLIESIGELFQNIYTGYVEPPIQPENVLESGRIVRWFHKHFYILLNDSHLPREHIVLQEKKIESQKGKFEHNLAKATELIKSRTGTTYPILNSEHYKFTSYFLEYDQSVVKFSHHML